MTKRKKATVGLLTFLCVAAVLLSALILSAPWLVEHTSVGDTVRREVSRLVGGEFSFRQLSFSFFPAPHAAISNPKFSQSRKLSASAEVVEIYPHFLPLLAGRVSLSKAFVKNPKVTLWVPDNSTEKITSSGPVAVRESLRALRKTLSAIYEHSLNVTNGAVSKGTFTLVNGAQSSVTLNDVEISVRSDEKQVFFEATAASDIFESLLVKGSIDGEQKKGSGRAELKNLHAGDVYRSFMPTSRLEIDDGDTDLSLDMTVENGGHPVVGFSAVIPVVRLGYAGRTTDLKVRRFSGRLESNRDSTKVILSDLSMEYPSLRVAGNFTLTGDDPTYSLHLEGHDVDIDSTRSVALALAGKDSGVQTLFDIVQGGKLPLVTVSSQGSSLAELGGVNNLTVRASNILSLDLAIPGANMTLHDVSGNVSVLHGILAGENIRARTNNSLIEDGTLTLDLTQDPLPLHVEAAVDADLADVQEILTQLIDNNDAKEELGLLQDVHGSARGKLVLGGDVEQVKVDVAASDIQLAARYRRIPFPLSITGGSAHYKGDTITWTQLSGTLGKSSIDELTGELEFNETYDFKVHSASSALSVSELLPWLSSYEKVRQLSRYLAGGEGVLQLSKVTLGGPLRDPSKWHFALEGEAGNLVIDNLPGNPGPLAISSLEFQADPHRLAYSNTRLNFLDSALMLSGQHLDYMAGLENDVKITLSGKVGPKTAQWLTRKTNCPPWVKLQPISLATSHLDYTTQPGRRLTATLSTPNDLRLLTDVSFNNNELVFHKLMLGDRFSQVTGNGRYRDRSVDLLFDGTVHQSTLNKIFAFSPGLSGSIAGRAKVRLNLSNLNDFGLTGEVSGRNITVPLASKALLAVNAITVRGAGQKIEIQPAELNVDDMQIILSGSIRPGSAGVIRVDLHVDTDSVDFDKLISDFKGLHESSGEKSGAIYNPLPITGEIRFSSKEITTKTIVIHPFQADIRVNKDSADITLKKAGLCSIPVSGTVQLSPHDIAYHLQADGKGQQLKSTLTCLNDQNINADGLFDLAGSLEGTLQGIDKSVDLFKVSSGHFELEVTDGHIYRDFLFLNVLKFLNINKVITDKALGETTKEGLNFKRLQTQITVESGKLKYDKIVLDSNMMKLTGAGEIDIARNRIHFTLLVAPQTAINSILGYVPLVGSLLQTIATIPLGVRGTVDDVHVLPLSPSAVGYEIKEVMKHTLGLPMKLIRLGDFVRQ